MMTCALYNGMLKVIVKYMVERERQGGEHLEQDSTNSWKWEGVRVSILLL